MVKLGPIMELPSRGSKEIVRVPVEVKGVWTGVSSEMQEWMVGFEEKVEKAKASVCRSRFSWVSPEG